MDNSQAPDPFPLPHVEFYFIAHLYSKLSNGHAIHEDDWKDSLQASDEHYTEKWLRGGEDRNLLPEIPIRDGLFEN